MKLVFGWRRFAVAALLAALMSVPVMAQGPGGFGRGGGGMMMGRGMMSGGALLGLLRMDEVQKELKLDEEQTKQIQSQMEKLQEKMQGMRPDFGNFRITGEEWYDRYRGVEELMPFAKAVSAKSHDFDDAGNETKTDYLKMMKIVLAAGYSGFVGIEYEGSKLDEYAGIRATKKLLEKVREQLG